MCASVFAQDFKVILATTAKVTRLTGGTSIKAMEELAITEIVNVPPGCVLILTDKSSSVFEFYGVGQVKLDTLKGSRTANAFDLSWINIFYSNALVLRKSRDDTAYVIFYPFAFSNTLSVVDSVTLQWKDRVLREGTHGDYAVVIKSEFGEPLLTELTGQISEIKLYMDKLNDEKAFIAIQHRRYSRTLRSDYRILQKRIAKCNDAPLNSLGTTLLTALYLEMNGFLLDAYDYFKRAEAMNPDFIEVKEIVTNFKKRNGFH